MRKILMIIIFIVALATLFMESGYSLTYEHYVNAFNDTWADMFIDGTEQNAYAIDSSTADSQDPTQDRTAEWWNVTTASDQGTINSVLLNVKMAVTGTSTDDYWQYWYKVVSIAGACESQIAPVGWINITWQISSAVGDAYYNVSDGGIGWADLDNVCFRVEYLRNTGDDNIDTQIDAFWVKVDYSPAADGSLNVSLMQPTSSPINVIQNSTFNVSANISCGGGACTGVNGTIFYNLTSNVYPDMELNGTSTDKPFNNFTNAVNLSCGSMASGETCYVSWLVNATGYIGSTWYLNVTTKSSNPTVIQNSTIPNFQVNIVAPPKGSLNVSLMNISYESAVNITQDTTFNVSANISCGGTGGAWCGAINGTIFYNLTSNAYPDMELNGTVDEKPFYNFTNAINISCGGMFAGDYCYVTWLVNATGYVGSTWKMNVTVKSDNSVTQNSTIPNFQVNIVKPRLNITLVVPESDKTIVDWYNFTIRGNVTCIGGGYCGNVDMAARYNTTGTADPDAYIPASGAPITTGGSNPYTCPGSMWSGDYCDNDWTIDIWESGSWVIDINTSSGEMYIDNNDSINRIITAPPGLLNWSNYTVDPTSLYANEIFWVNATVTCLNGLCFNITGHVRYNASAAGPPDTIIPTSGDPLHTYSNFRSCGNWTTNSTNCNIFFNVTATQAGGYNVDINFTSTDIPVPENDTDDTLVTVNLPPGSINVTLMNATYENPVNITQDTTFNVSANISCGGSGGAYCGNVNGTIFYNLTSNVYPDTELNGTVGEKPFYNYTNPVNYSCGAMFAGDYCYVTWLVNATGYVGSDWLLNVTSKAGNGVEQNSTIPNFQINIRKPLLNITLIYPDSNEYIVNWYNFSINGTIVCLGGVDCGNVLMSALYNVTDNTKPDTYIPEEGAQLSVGTGEGSPKTCVENPLTFGDRCSFNWTPMIIASGDWWIGVNVSSDNLKAEINNSVNRTVSAPPGWLNLSNFSVDPTSLLLDEIFWVNATVTCMDGLCFNITGNARYNATEPLKPDTVVPTSGDPLNTYFNPRSCGNNTVNWTNCNIFFNVTATIATNYSMDINFTSTDIPVPENDTDNITVEIISFIPLFAFSITFPGEALVNVSSPTFPGNVTNDIWFNATGTDSKYVEPCQADPSDGQPAAANCQDKAGDTPMLLFKNIGNVGFNITIRLNTTVGPSIELFANFSYTDGSGDYGGTSWCPSATLMDNDTEVDVSEIYFTRMLCVNNETNVFLFANFTYVLAGTTESVLNYTSSNTS